MGRLRASKDKKTKADRETMTECIIEIVRERERER